MSFYSIIQKAKALIIKDEGVTIASDADILDFTGTGVSASAVGSEITVDVSAGSSGTFVDGETPSGTINGSNDTFTLANTPTAGSVNVYLNGTRRTLTEDYTISGDTITFVSPPRSGSILRVDYRY